MKKGADILFEKITAPNFPNVGKYIDMQVKKAQIVTKRGQYWNLACKAKFNNLI